MGDGCASDLYSDGVVCVCVWGGRHRDEDELAARLESLELRLFHLRTMARACHASQVPCGRVMRAAPPRLARGAVHRDPPASPTVAPTRVPTVHSLPPSCAMEMHRETAQRRVLGLRLRPVPVLAGAAPARCAALPQPLDPLGARGSLRLYIPSRARVPGRARVRCAHRPFRAQHLAVRGSHEDHPTLFAAWQVGPGHAAGVGALRLRCALALGDAWGGGTRRVRLVREEGRDMSG